MTMERRCYTNEQYSRRECLEISDTSASVADNDLESKVLEIMEEIQVPINPSIVENCHRLPSKGSPKKVIKKLNRRRDIRRILLNKNRLKNLKPESVTCLGKQMFLLINVCACTTRNCGPNVKRCGVLVTFPRFGSAKDC